MFETGLTSFIGVRVQAFICASCPWWRAQIMNRLKKSIANCFHCMYDSYTVYIYTYCTDQKATSSWSVNIDNGLANGVEFRRSQKAFDTIDHNIAFSYGSFIHVDTSSLRWFESYLCDRSRNCSVHGHFSSIAPVSCGVPQASNQVGPLLFLVYINDLTNCLSG